MPNTTTIPIDANIDTESTAAQYLEFQVDQQIMMLLALTSVQEVLTIDTASVVPVPNLPPCILGMLNRRSHIYWLVDLAKIIGLKPLDISPYQYKVMIVNSANASLAIAVHDIFGVIKGEGDRLQPNSDLVPESLLPYVLDSVVLSDRTLHILNAAAVVNSPMLANG